ncbi:MAG TPA: hypothetical protein VMC08_00005, partial [Bacteroidales bacterium]|nr:hypothetical protein [Bacteroidales bacterium]
MSSKANNEEKFLKFRKRFPFFSYEGFDYTRHSEGLQVRYHFDLSGTWQFEPSLFIPSRSFYLPERPDPAALEHLLFHIGMAEMISYWKAACPEKILIKKYALSSRQIRWWKNLIYKGLGEFFYLNSIRIPENDFVEIIPGKEKKLPPFSLSTDESTLIPVGGGKDSAVTLELLGSLPGSLPMILNPREASLGTLRSKGLGEDQYVNVQRTIDPLLLKLNEEGYLNGHTPFSALLAFITLLAAALTGKRYIALSNESSANEATIKATGINHQYSKTMEFERDFRQYVSEFITRDIEYFSFLRPLNELQIASLFSSFPQYFPVFKSCNAGSKTDTWCGKCAKCLFTYIVLAPFLGKEQLHKIFGRDLFADPTLIQVLDDLTGNSETRPFDCVGTVGE